MKKLSRPVNPEKLTLSEIQRIMRYLGMPIVRIDVVPIEESDAPDAFEVVKLGEVYGALLQVAGAARMWRMTPEGKFEKDALLEALKRLDAAQTGPPPEGTTGAAP